MAKATSKKVFPTNLAQPAQRALAGAGIKSIKDIPNFTEEEIKNLHGVGQNTLKQIHQELKNQGLAFAKTK